MKAMELVGYADRLSVRPGETIRFMVSSARERYRADLVRLIHGDTNPAGPGFKERTVPSVIDGEYSGREQAIHPGSYVVVADHPALRLTGSFTVAAWIWPTRPGGWQVVLTKRSDEQDSGFGLVLDEQGSLTLRAGDGATGSFEVAAGVPVREREWYRVGAAYDAELGRVEVIQEPLSVWPGDPTGVVVEHRVKAGMSVATSAPLIIGAVSRDGGDGVASVAAHFNGKIEAPRIYGRALNLRELAVGRAEDAGDVAEALVAAWDLAGDFASGWIREKGPHHLDGRLVNLPSRAVTGHGWTGRDRNPSMARDEYGAIHFHEDDLEDAGWEADFALTVPDDLPSGVYAARLRAGNGEDHVPFFVRPPLGRPTASVAVLFPTLTYLAYANEQGTQNEYAAQLATPRENPAVDARELAYLRANKLLSLYDFHADGSGACYSSRLRPILNLRPKARMRHIDAPHGFAADLYLVDWLEHEGIAFDAITDEDLHRDGRALLDAYKVVMTGSHPEYWTEQMLEALEAYLGAGGRLMYLGGNGFYWVTSIDPERPHAIEVRRWGGTGAWKAEPGEYHHATTGELGGLWRNRGRAPQKLVGVGFTAQGFDVARPYRRQPDSFGPRVAWIFEGTGEDELIGDCPNLILGHGAAGHEVDRADRGLGTPAHTLVLATATGFSDGYQAVVEEILMADSRQGGTVNRRVRADMTYLEYPNGGAVFSVGSIAWCGALSANGYVNTVARVTGNVLRRFASS
jgi:N,N-dimethylformamidase